MKRIEIRITEAQHQTLKELARQRNMSISALVRQSLDHWLGQTPTANCEQDERIRRARMVSGKFRSGLPDISVNHDEYFVQAIEESLRNKRKRFEEQGFRCLP
jgi:AraC-like DNA-binding protein